MFFSNRIHQNWRLHLLILLMQLLVASGPYRNHGSIVACGTFIRSVLDNGNLCQSIQRTDPGLGHQSLMLNIIVAAVDLYKEPNKEPKGTSTNICPFSRNKVRAVLRFCLLLLRGCYTDFLPVLASVRRFPQCFLALCIKKSVEPIIKLLAGIVLCPV